MKDTIRNWFRSLNRGKRRKWAIGLVAVLGLGSPLLIQGYDRYGFKVTPCDYQLVVTVPGAPTRLEYQDAKESRSIHPDWVLSEPSLSPDVSHVVATRSYQTTPEQIPDKRELWLMDFPSGNNARVLVGRSDSSQPDFSPDGSKVIFIDKAENGDSQLAVTTLEGNVDTVPIRGVEGDPSQPSWSPDGSEIAFLDERGIVIIGSDGSDAQPIDRTRGAKGVTWDPEGEAVVATLSDGQIANIKLEDASQKSITTGRLTRWSPDGSCLFSSQTGYINAIPKVQDAIFLRAELKPLQEDVQFELQQYVQLPGTFDVGKPLEPLDGE